MRRFLIPAALALSVSAPAAAATIYASNFGNSTVTAYDASTGAFQGTPVTAGPEASGFNGILINADGSFVIAAQNSNNILHYSRTGALLQIFDPANSAGLNSPQGLTYGPDGKLYVASAGNDQILRYDPATGNFLDVFADIRKSGHVGPIDLRFGTDGNLYVTGFDNDQIIELDGATGAVVNVKQGPPGLGFGPAAFGPGRSLYVLALDLSSFAGSVYRYDPTTDALSLFVPEGTGGFGSPGGLAVGPGGNLLVADLVFDPDTFTDTGSGIRRFDALSGAPLGTLVGAGEGLNIPFFMTVAVPEPAGTALIGLGAILVLGRFRRAR